MEGFFAIKCRNCGGPMYSHQQTRSFDCAYCGASTPWAEGGPEPAPAMGIRHTPLQVVDGLLKLTHVSQLEPAQDSDWYYYKPYWRNMSLLERLLWEDPATADEFQNAEHVSVPCPFCGAAFVFRAKRADRIKLLVWDQTGMVLVHKRLEGGKFVWPQVRDGVMRLSSAQLAALFEGLDWRLVRPERVRRPLVAG